MARSQSTLILAEQTGDGLLSRNTRHSITAAKQLGGEISCLIAGTQTQKAVEEVAAIAGISKVIVAESPAFNGALAENVAPTVLAAQDQFKFTHILSGSSAFSRSVLPRVAAKLDVSPISDIIGIKVILVILKKSHWNSYFKICIHIQRPKFMCCAYDHILKILSSAHF